MLSKKIVSFLKERPLISVKGLEHALGLPDSTIRHAMTGNREIPCKYLHDIIVHLINYGFTLNGYNMKYDSSDGSILFEKIVRQISFMDTGNHFEYHCIVYRDIIFDDIAVSHYNYKTKGSS